MAESDDALYVAFMGTKQMRDIATNANISLAALWPTEGSEEQVNKHTCLIFAHLGAVHLLCSSRAASAFTMRFGRHSVDCRASPKRMRALCSEPAPSALVHCRSAQRCWGSAWSCAVSWPGPL